MNKPREKPKTEDEPNQERAQDVKKDWDIERPPTHGMRYLSSVTNVTIGDTRAALRYRNLLT